MRSLPHSLTAYKGLTVVLSEPSRHDTKELISGWAGKLFWSSLYPLERGSIDIQLADCNDGFLPGTKVALLLGDAALAKFKPDITLNDQRGSPFVLNDIIYIASYAPQDAADRFEFGSNDDKDSETETVSEKSHQKTRRKNWRFWLAKDIAKTMKILFNGLETYPRFDYHFDTDIGQLNNTLRSTKNQRLAFDIETDENQFLTCVGFSFFCDYPTDGHPVFVVPFTKFGYLSAEDKRSFIVSLAIAFRDNVVVAHNGCTFDWFVMAWKYKVPYPRQPYDTMLGQHRCYPEIEKSLGHLISLLTDLFYHKNEGIFNPRTPQENRALLEYNGKDVSTLIICYFKQQKEIAKQRCALAVEQANRSIKPYLTMMYKGIRLDVDTFLRMFDDCERRGLLLTRCLAIICNKQINPRSPLQVSNYLYKDLGYEMPADDPTNEKTLLRLLVKNNVPSVKVILSIRKVRKLSSSLKFRLWSNGFDAPDTSTSGAGDYCRATCVYHVGGTDTFRLSSKKLLKFHPDPGWGNNMQNWDKAKRHLCIADPGKMMGQTDQSGADTLIVSRLCRKGNFRKLFDERIKPHTFIAMHTFKPQWCQHFDPIVVNKCCSSRIEDLKNIDGWKEFHKLIKSSDDWPSNRRYYYMGKKTIHAFDYGMKAPTMQITILQETDGLVVLTEKECRYMLGVTGDLFPEIEEWHYEIQETIKSSRRLFNLQGHPRQFHQPFGDELWRSAYIFIPQSTVGTITNEAATALQETIESGDVFLQDAGFDLLQNGHDSLLWQAKEEYAEDCARYVKHFIEATLTSPKDGSQFKMGSGTSLGYNWGPYHETKNPRGLREIDL